MMNKKNKKDTCFVIMPFGGWFDEYYDNIFQPAIRDAGLEPKRADDLYRPSQIISDIWEYTKKSKIILADLSNKNPNVFYELGLAHAISKPVIMITESIDDIPFDLRGLRIIKYDKNVHNWGEKLKENINKAISEVLEDLIGAVPQTFINVTENKKITAISDTEKELISLKQDVESIKREMSLRSGIPHNRYHEVRPEEAISLIKMYLEEGMPKDIIIDRLIRRGVPEGWIVSRITEYSKINRDNK